ETRGALDLVGGSSGAPLESLREGAGGGGGGIGFCVSNGGAHWGPSGNVRPCRGTVVVLIVGGAGCRVPGHAGRAEGIRWSGRVGYPLTAPCMMPLTICRPKTTNSASSGRVPSSAPAMISESSRMYPSLSLVSATGTVGFCMSSAMYGQKKSFQACTNVIMN